MKLGDVFIGPALYWLLWVVIIAVLVVLGLMEMHTRHFNPFSFILLGVTAAAVAVILVTYRKGERITREPFEKE